jgi:TonB-linked SusC/RagA family outer membrane protein
MQSPLKTPKPLPAYAYVYLYNEALQNDGKTPAYSPDDFEHYRNGSSPYLYPDVNWYDEILRQSAPISRYNLNVNGGIKNARYSVSLSYLNQQGLFKTAPGVDYNTNLELNRYLINSDIDVDVTKDFTVSLQLFGRIQDGNQPGAGTAAILSQLYTTPGNAYPVFNPDGSYGGSADHQSNLYQLATGSGYLLDNTRDVLANIDLKYRFDHWLPGLYAKAKVNVSATSSSVVDRSKSTPVYDFTVNGAGDSAYTRYGSIRNQPNAFNMTSTAQFFYAQAAIGYDSSVGRSSFGGMLFADQQIVTYGFDLPEKYTDLAFTAHYDYGHRYFAQAAVNYAGFDRYAPGHRFGFVYAAGLGWDLAQESFIKDHVGWIDQLKIRGTYGQTASTNEGALGYFPWRSAFGQDGTNGYPSGESYSMVYGIAELGLANVKATWEKAHKLDVGADAALFHRHVTVTADYYHDLYYDLLEQRGATIALIGLPYPNENIGRYLYEGQEISVGYENHLRNFNYFITVNASRMRTEVLYMDELQQAYPWNRRTGKPVGQTFGYKADGLIQTQKEAEAAATFAGVTVYPGDIRLEDLNHDGVINQFDETAIGNTRPVIYYGITAGFNWKGFDFSLLLQGVKNRTYQQTDYSFGSGGKDQGYEYLMGRWTPETAAIATYPRLTVGFNANNTPYLNNSSYWTRSGEYFRIRNIALGYTVPYRLTRKVRIAQLRFFADAQNLFTQTPYDRLDPEVYSSTAYPMQRIINMGVNIKF